MSTPTQPASEPAQPYTPAAPNTAEILYREVQMMQASGWTLLQRWPGGADFQSVSSGGFPGWAHVLLLLLTVGLWLFVMIPMLLFSDAGTHKWCRLTIDEHGQPQYQEIGRPKGT